jgi:uncharacterized membrane protein
MFEITSLRRAGWLTPAGLIALSVIPILAGAIRLSQIGAGADITPENARFIAAPLPIVLHLLGATFFCVFGALQFVPGLRHGRVNWHRVAGRASMPLGLLAALSGLWMTQFYPVGGHPPASFDGPFVYASRLLAGSSMALFLCLGLAAALRREIPQHRAWMIRAYAIGLGAGTQVITHLLWFLFPGIQGEFARAFCMASAWVINLAIAEWLIDRSRSQ